MTQLLHETSASGHASDQEAGRLYAEYGDRILRYCRGQLRSHEEAEDAVQNTFLRVTTALRKGVVPEFEGPWLYKIAHNVCLSRRLGSSRRARVETPADIDALADYAAAYTPDADELFGLDDALADMPPNLRRPLLLREWQGMSYLEIAEALGVSHSAVETLIFRARRHLAQALTDSVKKTGRAIASVLPFRWLVEALRGLGPGASGGGLAAGAAALVVAIGGGVAIDLTSAHASPARGTAAAGYGGPAPATPVRAGAAATAAARVHGTTPAERTASHTVGVGHRAATGGSGVARGGAAAQGAGPGVAETPSATGTGSSSGAAAGSAGRSSSKATSPSKAGGGSSSRRAAPGKGKASPQLPVPSAPSLPPIPALPDPGSLLPPVSVPPLPAVPAVPALPDPPIIDPPALPPVPPVPVPPVPPVPPVLPVPPVPPLPPAPPVPPLPAPLAPVAPAAAHAAAS